MRKHSLTLFPELPATMDSKTTPVDRNEVASAEDLLSDDSKNAYYKGINLAKRVISYEGKMTLEFVEEIYNQYKTLEYGEHSFLTQLQQADAGGGEGLKRCVDFIKLYVQSIVVKKDYKTRHNLTLNIEEIALVPEMVAAGFGLINTRNRLNEEMHHVLGHEAHTGVWKGF